MGRNEYNQWGQTGTTPRHVIPSERSEPRNLPKLQVLSCGGSFTNVVDSSTTLTLRSEWHIGGLVSYFHTECVRYVVMAMNHRRYIAWFCSTTRIDIRYVFGTAHRPFPTVSLIGAFFIQRISETNTSVSKTVNYQILFPWHAKPPPLGLGGGFCGFGQCAASSSW